MDTAFKEASRLVQAGLFAQARHALRSITTKPQQTSHTLLLAEVLERLGIRRAGELTHELLRSTQDDSVKGRCEILLGRISYEQGQVLAALQHFERAAALLRDDAEHLCWAQLRLMATTAEYSGTLGSILPQVRYNIARTGDGQLLSALHICVAQIEGRNGRFHNSLHHSTLAAEFLRKCPNAWLEGSIASIRFCAAFLQSDMATAKLEGRRALAAARMSGHAVLLTSAIGNIGHLLLSEGDFSGAQRYLDQALRRSGPGGWGELAALEGLARMELARRNLDNCDAYLQRAERIAAESDFGRGLHRSWIIETRVRFLIRCSQFSGAVDLSQKARQHAPQSADRPLKQLLRLLAAEAAGLRNDPAAATLLAEAIDTTDDASIETLAEIQRVAGKALAREHPGRAAEHFERSARILGSVGNLCLRLDTVRDYAAAVSPRTPDGTSDPAADIVAPEELPRLFHRPARTTIHHGTFTPRCGVSPSPALATERAAALIDLAAHPDLLGHELGALIMTSDCAHGAVLVSRDADHRPEIVATWNLPYEEARAFAASPRCATRLALGTAHSRTFELLVDAPVDVASLTTIMAAKKLVTAGRALEAARREARERTALWPIEELSEACRGVFASERSLELLTTARKIATTPVNVLITGETGTGKELLARVIHDASPRATKPFLPFNCTAVPRDMIESQLFGHRRGAFTGAHEAFPGVIRAAAGGTLFLDEIGDVSLDLQPKLLRFLESGEIHPLGEPQPIPVDVRVIAATNANLDDLVAHGRFREDLFYRLNVIRLRIPPLRERREEIPLLVEHFLRQFGDEFHKTHLRVGEDTMEYLLLFHWPGNVRQLANELRRLAALAENGAVLMPEHLSPDITAGRRTVPASRRDLPSTEIVVRLDQPMAAAVEHIERAMLQHALSAAGGRLDPAARALGLSRKGLYLKRQRLGIATPIAEDNGAATAVACS